MMTDSDIVQADASISINIVHAINDAHRRILEAKSSPEKGLTGTINDILSKPYALECAYALADKRTSGVWFVGACAHEQWPLLRWLIYMYGKPYVAYPERAFYAACKHRREAIALWLTRLYCYDVDNANSMLRYALDQGMFRLAKHFFKEYDFCFAVPNDIVELKRTAFVRACKYKCIWFIRWLIKTYGLTQNDVRYEQMDALGSACAHGHWRLARWMVIKFELTRMHIRSAQCDPLIRACANGQRPIAQWLVEHFRLGAPYARADRNDAFTRACGRGQLEIVQWMSDRFQMTTRDACAHHNTALARAVESGHIAVAQWLVARFGLGREGVRISMKCFYIGMPIVTMKWIITSLGSHRRWKDDWYTQLVSAVSCEGYMEFAWWVAKKFGIAPYDIKPTVDAYINRLRALVHRSAHTQRIERVQQWFDAIAAEW